MDHSDESDAVARGNQWARAVRAPAGTPGAATRALRLTLRLLSTLMLVVAVLLPPALVVGMVWVGAKKHAWSSVAAGVLVGALWVMILRGVLRKALAERRSA